jgi:hypothetical protein
LRAGEFLTNQVSGFASGAERRMTTLARWVVQRRPAEVHIRHLQRKVRLPGLREAETIKETCNRMWSRPMADRP